MTRRKATKKAKAKAKAKARKPDPKVWALPKFRTLLDGNGCVSADALKLVIENQRGINGKLYEAIEEAIKAIKKDHPERAKANNGKPSPLAEALALVKTVPGDGPPGCPGS